MTFKLADSPNSEVVDFLKSVNINEIEEEVLRNASWGSHPIDDVIKALIRKAQENDF